MEVKGINRSLNNIFFVSVLLLSIYFYLKIEFNNSKVLNSNFPELNNMELYINCTPEYAINLTEQLNANNTNFYSYIDNSRELLIYNSLKKSSIEHLDIYSSIFIKPDFNNLFHSISDLSLNADNERNAIINLISRTTSVIVKYLTNESDASDVGLNILESIVLDDLVESKYRSFYKINIVLEKKHNNKSTFKENYIKIFKHLQYLESVNINMKYIKFYNPYIYDLFINYNKDSNFTAIPEYQDFILCYSDSLESHNSLLTEKLYDKDIKINSLYNYLTDNTLKGEKFKKIKKIHYNVNQYDPNKNKWLQYQGISNILKNIDKTELNLNKFMVSNNIEGDIIIEQILGKLSFIKNYLNSNKNKYNTNYLINNYNEHAQKFIKNVANTEPVSLNFIDPYIYQYYYNDMMDKYVLFVDCNNSEECNNYLYKTYDNECSIYPHKKIKYLNLSLYVYIILMIILIMFNLAKSKNEN